MAATNLDVELISDGFESWHVSHQVWELDMDRGAERGAEVGWARGDVADVSVVEELSTSLNA